jgi:hypothetical protein
MHNMHFTGGNSKFDQRLATGLIDCDNAIGLSVSPIGLPPVRLGEPAGHIMPMRVSVKTTSRSTHGVNPRNCKIKILTHHRLNTVLA